MYLHNAFILLTELLKNEIYIYKDVSQNMLIQGSKN